MNRPSPVLGFGVVPLAVAAAMLLRWPLWPVLQGEFAFLFLWPVVLGCAWYGGLGPGLLATTLSATAAAFFLLEPRFSLAAAAPHEWVGLLVFVSVNVAISLLCEKIHQGRQRSKRQAEEVARQGEWLRVSLASIGDGVIAVDGQGRVVFMNPTAEALTGWCQAGARGQPFESVFPIINEQTRLRVENPVGKVLREGVVIGLANHTILLTKGGGERPIEDSAAPIKADDGKTVGVILVFRDVSEKRRLEKENASRYLDARFLASIVESSSDAIISKSLDGIIRTWNAAAERLFGYPAAEAVGRHVSLIIPADRLAEEDRIIASLQAGQRIDHFETLRLRSDGQAIPVSLTISPIKDEAGRVIGVSKIARDITDRQRAEADRQMFVTLVENSTDFIGMCDVEGVPFFINGAGLRLVGLESIEEARRTPVRDFFFPEDQGRIMGEFLPSVLAKGHGETEVRFRHFKTGAARWMAYKVLTLTGATGRAAAFATVSQDVTERRRLEDHLRQLAADLSEADRRKDEFLATLAHELRNPLAPIRNALQIIRLSPDGEAREQARATMERQLEQMVRLVDDLMDVSRITRGKLELRREQVQLAAVVNSAVETGHPLIDHMGHELTVALPEQPTLVDGDPTRLAQVFSNLLTNAAKYSDRGGHIWLTAERRGGEVVVSVRDTGIGIAADQLPHIFDLFSQLDRSLERSQGGLGIGLSLVRRLVEMHGGTVEARSGGPGKGSEFVVRLPIIVQAPAAQAPSGNGEAAAPKSSLRILIVDDNRDGADSLGMMLRLMGNETRTAYDGLEALDAAAAFRPDVILLDIGLPKLNGHEACRRLRERPGGQELLIIAQTGWGQEEDRQRTQEAGFDYHMVKPVDPAALMQLLAGLEKSSF